MADKLVSINYLSKDFNSIKRQLIEHAKRYYPNTYKDFNEASFGSLLMDWVAYVGDVLSFYQDYQTNESFLNTAIEYGNIVNIGRQQGYKFSSNPSSQVVLSCFIKVPASSTGLGMDTDYIPDLLAGSEFVSKNGNTFMLLEDVNFKSEMLEVAVCEVDSSLGNTPTFYAIKAYGVASSGILKEQYSVINSYERFLRIPLDDTDISEIVSVFDSDGNEYYEVDYLSQNLIYKSVLNKDNNGSGPRSLLKPILVPRRFTVEREDGKVYLQFGYGSETQVTDDDITNPSKVVLHSYGKSYINSVEFDPARLITTDKMGIVPSNTTLRVVYRTNTASTTSAGTDTITNVSKPIFRFENENNLSETLKKNIVNSLEVTNEEPAIGDVMVMNSDELKKRIMDSFSTQRRIVTLSDYKAFCYMMPSKFGAIKRCNPVSLNSEYNQKIKLFIIGEDENSKLSAANNVVKENLKNWLASYKVINDVVEIEDAKIINLGVDFKVIADENTNKYSLLKTCIEVLTNYFQTLPEIGEYFSITNVFSELKNIVGVVDVAYVKIKQKTGNNYSNLIYNLRKFYSDDGRKIWFPKNVIWEVKYPNDDIGGVVG